MPTDPNDRSVTKLIREGSLGALSLAELRGQAANAYSPGFMSNILPETDPRAQRIMAQQLKIRQEAAARARGETSPVVEGSSKKKKLSPGDRVYHQKRQAYGVVLEASADNKRIAVKIEEKAQLVQIVNLKRV